MWYFSIVDVVAVLTGQPTQRGAGNYWVKLKQRLKAKGADQLMTNCQQLKMLSSDGKRYNTDVADTGQLLRIIQSIPSPKAEPFKLWLAEVGRQRIEKTINHDTGDIDVADLLAILNLFNIDRYSGMTSFPINSYSSKKSALICTFLTISSTVSVRRILM